MPFYDMDMVSAHVTLSHDEENLIRDITSSENDSAFSQFIDMRSDGLDIIKRYGNIHNGLCSY